jgi:hypothetical protein
VRTVTANELQSPPSSQKQAMWWNCASQHGTGLLAAQ